MHKQEQKRSIGRRYCVLPLWHVVFYCLLMLVSISIVKGKSNNNIFEHNNNDKESSSSDQNKLTSWMIIMLSYGFMSETNYHKCVLDLNKADKNNDNKLKSSEWTKFIYLYSNKYIDKSTEFKDLPLSLVSLFHITACSQCMEKEIRSSTSNTMSKSEPQLYSSTCCVGSKAHIDIDSNNDGFYSSNDVMLLSLCMKVDSAFDDILPPPTPAPTTEDSDSPTIMDTTMLPTTSNPTILSSESPTAMPSPKITSAQPSILPTASPSFVETSAPSLLLTQEPSIILYSTYLPSMPPTTITPIIVTYIPTTGKF